MVEPDPTHFDISQRIQRDSIREDPLATGTLPARPPFSIDHSNATASVPTGRDLSAARLTKQCYASALFRMEPGRSITGIR